MTEAVVCVELMDGRTGRPVYVGDVLRSVERGDLVVVEDMSTDGDEMDVRLVPVGERFTARARHDPELGGPSLRGFWLA